MDGQFFYWFTWMLWIQTTFFLNKKHKNRLNFTILLLAAIIVSPYQINMFDFNISLLLACLYIGVFFYINIFRKKTLLYFLLSAFFMMLAYCSFHLLSILDPIWIIFNKEWLLSISLIIVARLIYKEPTKQILLIIFGSVNGDVLYGILLKKYQYSYTIGSMNFFDSLLISIAGIITFYTVKLSLLRWEKYVYIMEKEKQKLL
ncbi:hypothetical protein [Niallia sp. NCCP-28]|uniref:YphA family membrane protein n=1 Tax=Niallia sp. NCCP-28 TaxID=2934712 RepID=UPI002084A157|nr:hypothetical protein [Niallia sp. NCCP-28]GKU81017.1 hypothetical protein NCCP28_04130 [Niallia sp. NCCP-28]